jgi:hypothetical protein
MDIKHITSDSLRRLLSLTTKKEQLIKAVSDVENEIARALKGAATTAVEVAEAVTPFKPKKKSKGSKPGSLKDRILALLEAAGDEGVRVKDIAEKLAAKPGNIAVWFSTTGKAITTKVSPGRFARKGAEKSSAMAKPAKAPKPAKKPRKAKKKSGLTPEGRAKLAANMKARWAARKAGKPAAKVGKPAKKGFKLPKKA